MKKSMHLAILLLFLPFLISSCKTQEGENAKETSESVSDSAAQTETPQIKKVGHIPVYEQFADLEPIFNQETDSTYVINFWATWCKPCVEELPYFEALHQQFSGEKLKVVLVSLDFPDKLESKLLPFVEEHQLESDVVALTDIDYNTWINKVNPDWGGAIPVTLVYNASERKFVSEQFANAEELNNLVKSLL